MSNKHAFRADRRGFQASEPRQVRTSMSRRTGFPPAPSTSAPSRILNPQNRTFPNENPRGSKFGTLIFNNLRRAIPELPFGFYCAFWSRTLLAICSKPNRAARVSERPSSGDTFQNARPMPHVCTSRSTRRAGKLFACAPCELDL